MAETFNVVMFFPDGSYNYERRSVPAEEAMTVFGECTRRPAVLLGIIARVIVTDDGDSTCAEWKNGEGFTFPPELVEQAKARGMQ